MAESGIYAIINRVNGASYIGSAVSFRKRWIAHRSLLRRGRHHSIMLQRAWAKYGEDAFEFCRLLECPISELLATEQKFLDEKRPRYNVCRVAGSCLGVRHSPEANRRKGRPGVELSSEHSRAIGRALVGNQNARGCQRSPETRAKMSAAFKGKPLSDEHRAKLSAAKKGRVLTPDHRAKIAEAQRGLKHHGADRELYTIANISGERLTDVQITLRARTGLSGPELTGLIKGSRRTAKGWRLASE